MDNVPRGKGQGRSAVLNLARNAKAEVLGHLAPSCSYPHGPRILPCWGPQEPVHIALHCLYLAGVTLLLSHRHRTETRSPSTGRCLKSYPVPLCSSHSGQYRYHPFYTGHSPCSPCSSSSPSPPGESQIIGKTSMTCSLLVLS